MYWLAEREAKVSLLGSRRITWPWKSAMWIVNSVDRRAKENPWASLKHAAQSNPLNHLQNQVEIQYTQRWWDLWVHQENPHSTFFPFFLPLFVLYRPRAAQVRVKARAGWCFCERDKHSGVNNSEDQVHLTSSANKSTNPRRPQRSQKGKWGFSGWQEPHSLHFYRQESGVWGPYKAVSAPRPHGNGLELGDQQDGLSPLRRWDVTVRLINDGGKKNTCGRGARVFLRVDQKVEAGWAFF